MNHTRLPNPRAIKRDRQRLVGKHCGQMLANPPGPELIGMAAITFEPARRAPSFLEETIRPLGTTLMVLAHYHEHPIRPGRICMSVYGMYGRPSVDGSVQYGGQEALTFVRDAAIRSRAKGKGRAINYRRELPLLETVLRMDSACRRALLRRHRLPSVPRMPSILLGFAPSEVPQFEDSMALRCLAAKQLGVSVSRLGMNGEVLLERLLMDTWESQLIMPDDSRNPTGLVLVDAELCTSARRSLRIFEDYGMLCGDHAWNPAREMKVPMIDNPALVILRRHGIESSGDFDRVGHDQLEQLELEMRQALDGGFEGIDQDFIFDALTNSAVPVMDVPTVVRSLREQLLRSMSASCTDADLVQAAANPAEPLHVSGRCRLQLVDGYRSGFGPDELGRRVSVRFNSAPLARV